MEITTTRHNHLIDPHLEIWEWQIPAYLFLGGLVGGMMILAGYLYLKGKLFEENSVTRAVPLLGIILLSLGMFFLFLDLEYKVHVWRLYTTFQVSSPMSWGAWILILVYPALVAALLLNIPEFLKSYLPWLKEIETKLRNNKSAVNTIAYLNIAFGILLAMYTGVLLSSLGARPLWNTEILWLLFLVSGLSGAAALLHLISKDHLEKDFLVKADNLFLTVEFLVIVMFVVGFVSGSEMKNEAISLLLNGSFASVFWVIVVGMGILAPLFIQLLDASKKIKHTTVPAYLVLLGGLVLRFVIVFAGEYSHWAH